MSRFKFRVWESGYGYMHTIPLKDMFHYGTPEQCTGLKDKNGKLIYEGDILFVPEGWCGDYFRTQKHIDVEWIEDPDEVGFFVSFPNGVKYSDCEVIGNIHENPELLEVKNG
jgi:uncharacterized phage protein (TIGR01671 family)